MDKAAIGEEKQTNNPPPLKSENFPIFSFFSHSGFGPEVSAIIEDDSPASTRWRYFLRYFQGKVNGQNIDNFDEEEEGFRSFILMTFHPSVTDTLGSFHLTKQFLLILDAILEQVWNFLPEQLVTTCSSCNPFLLPVPPQGRQRPRHAPGLPPGGGVDPLLHRVSPAAERLGHAPGRPLPDGQDGRLLLRHAQEEPIRESQAKR